MTVRLRFQKTSTDEMLVCTQLRAEFNTPQEAEMMAEMIRPKCEILPNGGNRFSLSAGCLAEIPATPRAVKRFVGVYLDEVVGEDPNGTKAYHVYVESEEGLTPWKAFYTQPNAIPGKSRSLRSIPLGRTIFIFSSDNEGYGELMVARGAHVAQDQVEIKLNCLGKFQNARRSANPDKPVLTTSGSVDRSIREYEEQIALVVADAMSSKLVTHT